MLLRDIQQAKDHGRKLDPRWTTPRIVVSISTSGVSCNVRQLHDPPTITKRYHLDDLVVYVSRNPSTALSSAVGRSVVYSRDAFGATVAFVDGQRAFHLVVTWPGNSSCVLEDRADAAFAQTLFCFVPFRSPAERTVTEPWSVQGEAGGASDRGHK